ncbi:DUF3795 domain-containing protein [bacterium]|nr:DUF3795 domain-containing protein [bacterium]
MIKLDNPIGYCGLDCINQCTIIHAPYNEKIANDLAIHFRKMGHKDAEPNWFSCKGCRGDRNQHWSASCWIMQCCADQKNLEYCSECNDFPCAPLQEWSTKDSRYSVALQRLKDMAANKAV